MLKIIQMTHVVLFLNFFLIEFQVKGQIYFFFKFISKYLHMHSPQTRNLSMLLSIPSVQFSQDGGGHMPTKPERVQLATCTQTEIGGPILREKETHWELLRVSNDLNSPVLINLI